MGEKSTVFSLRDNYSIDLRLHTPYRSNVLTTSTTTTTIYFVLRVVSADLQTSRSEEHH